MKKKKVKKSVKVALDGFKVSYRDSSGSVSQTYFGQPFSSLIDSMDDESYIRLVFSYAYPDCQILSIVPSKIDF